MAATSISDTRAREILDQLDDAMETHEPLKRKLKTLEKEGTLQMAATVAYGGRDEWWSMSWSTVGVSKSGVRLWALSVSDSTQMPHPHSGKIVYTKVHEADTPPDASLCETAILTAICYPAPGAGPARRPRRLLVAWRMRSVRPAAALERVVDGSLGIVLELEGRRVAVGIAAAHGTDIEGYNH